MEDYVYRNIRGNWRYLHPINKLVTRIDYFIENAARKFKNHLKTAVIFSTGFLFRDILALTLENVTNIFPQLDSVLHLNLNENQNNFFLMLYILVFLLLTYFILSRQAPKIRNRRWYE